MAGSSIKEVTPSNKRARAATRSSVCSHKKKRLTTTSIASITPVNLDSDSEEEMATRTTDETDENEFQVKKPPNTIAVGDLELLLDKRFSVLATANQIQKMGERITRNESEITEIRVEISQINKKLSQPKTSVDPQLPSRLEPISTNPGRDRIYNQSRRSIRVWPISGKNDNEMRTTFSEFARSALKIPLTTLLGWSSRE